MSALKIGWGSRDISTERPVDIPGQFYIRVSKGVLDPVTVTALALERNGEAAVFVSADLVGIRPYLLREVRAKAAETLPGFPVEKIIISATHTHAGPGYYLAGMATPDEVPHEGIEIAPGDEYREFLVSRIVEAIAEAWTARAAGGIAWGYGFAVAGHSRRVVFFDDLSKRPEFVGRPGMFANGCAAMYGSTADDNFSHYEAGTDHFVNLLYTFDPAGGLTGAVVNLPCPSQNSANEWRLSADFWHETRLAVRARHGDIYLLPQCAAAGDLSPVIMHYREAQARRFALKYGPEDPGGPRGMPERRDIAERIAGAFDEVLDWAARDIRADLPLAHSVRPVRLSRRMITREEYEAEVRQLAELEKAPFAREGTPEEKLRHDSTLVARRKRCRRIIERYREQDREPALAMELHAVGLGEIAFATNSFEMFMDYMHRIQGRSPFSQTFVVQLCGTPEPCSGYLATGRAAAGRGYSASLYCNQVSPAGGRELVEATVSLLREIHPGRPAAG